MKLRSLARGLWLFLLFALGGGAAGQAPMRLQGSVYEDFGGLRPQSAPSGLVVGVIQGPVAGAPDLTQLRALVPRTQASRRLCLAVTTFDSVYLARGALTTPPDAAGPLGIGDPNFSKHRAQVKTYSDVELAAGFILSADCELLNEKPLTLLPATFGGPIDLVRVALNTRAPTRLAVAIETEGGRRFDATCRALGGRAKAFTFVCDARIEPAAFGNRPGRLTITRKLLDVPERTDDYRVWIAPAS